MRTQKNQDPLPLPNSQTPHPIHPTRITMLVASQIAASIRLLKTERSTSMKGFSSTGGSIVPGG